MATEAYDLPEEIWECIFKMLNGDVETLKSVSLVSKPFLTISSRLRFSLNITDKTIPFKITDETIAIFNRLLQRFSNLTSLTFKIYSESLKLNSLLTRISTFPNNLSHIRSLALFKITDNIPSDGLRAISKKMTNLKSLTCSKMHHVQKSDLFLMADCFPLLEELDLSYPVITTHHDFEPPATDDHHHFLSLPKLRKVNLYGNRIDRPTFDSIFRNCQLLQEVIFIEWRIWLKIRHTQARLLISL